MGNTQDIFSERRIKKMNDIKLNQVTSRIKLLTKNENLFN